MSLTAEQIMVGIVAYFDVSVLNQSATLAIPSSPTTRSGPFVCFQAEGGRSAWAAISTTARLERLEIVAAWRSGRSAKWRSTPQYLNDGSTTYVGPDAEFVRAAAAQDTFSMANRPRVSEEGVLAVFAEISARGGTHL